MCLGDKVTAKSYSFRSRLRAKWQEIPEVGTTIGIRIVLAVSRYGGRSAARFIIWFIALYYAIISRRVARYSAEYQRRLGQKPTFLRFFRHILRFSQCTLDRLYFLRGDLRYFDVRLNGSNYLTELKQQKRGALILSAHLGSFESMRAIAQDDSIPLNVVGYFHNARMLNTILDGQGDNSGARLIDANAHPLDLALRIQEAIEKGELVAILGDRTGYGSSTEVEFFGEKTAFPVGVYLLAAQLRCPIYLAFGLHYSPNKYDLYCEPFIETLDLPRSKRQEILQQQARRYAARLEHYCEKAPDNWFNFYDFWKQGSN